MSKQKAFLFLFSQVVLASAVSGQARLFYLEAQAVAGYSSSLSRWVYYSLHPEDAMQKPSLGFDCVQRFARETGDYAVLAVQARLAWNADSQKPELQLYNAFFKLKLPGVDLWAGHSRPAFGLSSVFDVHSEILPTLMMYGYAYDRDWGVGILRDFLRGSWSVSVTTGSGMALRLGKGYLFSGRLSFGVLGRDNWSVGFSESCGEAIETMGDSEMSSGPKPHRLAGLDITLVTNNLENRLEAVIGRKYGLEAGAVFWRLGINFLEEERLRWEIQPILMREDGKNSLKLATGLSFVAMSDLTLRLMYVYNREERDSRVVFQAYYYKRLAF